MSATALSGYFRDQARWRRLKAEEYPEDKRNQYSADALESLAEYVDAGGSADSVAGILAIAGSDPSYFGLGEEANRVISRYGFHQERWTVHQPVTTDEHDQLLKGLVVLILEDQFSDFYDDDDAGAEPS